MRIWVVVAICAALGGCAASRQEVVAQLGQEFIVQNVDALVVQWGPTANTFIMNSGDTSYVWQLGNKTDIAADHGSGFASTRFCKVDVFASPKGIVTQLNTEDSNAGAASSALWVATAASAETASD
jgi:hypothetical protein